MQQARRRHEVHEPQLIGWEAIAALPRLDKGACPRQRFAGVPLRLDLLEGLQPAQETHMEIGWHVSAAPKLLQRGDGTRKVMTHPQDDLQVVLKDTQAINGRCSYGRGAEERFTGLEGGVKLPGSHG